LFRSSSNLAEVKSVHSPPNDDLRSFCVVPFACAAILLLLVISGWRSGKMPGGGRNRHKPPVCRATEPINFWLAVIVCLLGGVVMLMTGALVLLLC
jgi:hypothetical protein